MKSKQQALPNEETKGNPVVDVEKILDKDTERQQVLNNSIDTMLLSQENDILNVESSGLSTHTFRTDSYRSHATSSYPG
jgi:hypothetical protein